MTKRPLKLSHEELHRIIIKSLAEDTLIFCPHAIEQMNKRGITLPQVVRVLEKGSRLKKVEHIVDGAWRYAFQNFEKDFTKPIRVIVVVEEETVVVTVMWDNRYG